MYELIKWKVLYSMIEPAPHKPVIYAIQTVSFYKEQYQYGNTSLFS